MVVLYVCTKNAYIRGGGSGCLFVACLLVTRVLPSTRIIGSCVLCLPSSCVVHISQRLIFSVPRISKFVFILRQCRRWVGRPQGLRHVHGGEQRAHQVRRRRQRDLRGPGARGGDVTRDRPIPTERFLVGLVFFFFLSRVCVYLKKLCRFLLLLCYFRRLRRLFVFGVCVDVCRRLLSLLFLFFFAVFVFFSLLLLGSHAFPVGSVCSTRRQIEVSAV